MKYSEWLETVPADIRADTLWKMEAYRLALFAAELAWRDVTKLFRDGRTVKLAGQLFEAVGSVGANISEGYSRGSHKDQARFYEYSLGSARESRTWYYDARQALGPEAAEHRIHLHTHIIRLLLGTLPSVRGYVLHEADEPGIAWRDDTAEPASALKQLLDDVPLPEP